MEDTATELKGMVDHNFRTVGGGCQRVNLANVCIAVWRDIESIYETTRSSH